MSGGYSFDYVYNYTDHLGNIRLSYTQDPQTGILAILEENHYYPFGLQHKNYRAERQKTARWAVLANEPACRAGITKIDLLPEQNNEKGLKEAAPPTVPLQNPGYMYKYNGKELQNEFGVEMYDFGARNYDPALGRWMNIDPLAERYSNYTPYNYVANTPLQAIDPDGKAIIFIGGLRLWQGATDQQIGRLHNDALNNRSWIYRTDVTNYWSTQGNSTNYHGRSARIDGMFMNAYKDDNAFYISGSSSHQSSAKRRIAEGGRKAELFHKFHGYGAGKYASIKEGEAIRVVSHSQGGAHAVGFISQLLTYKNETGNNLYNVEIIFYLNPHQPGDITNPKGVEAIQYSVTTDQISGNGLLSFLGLNGGSEYAPINGAQQNYLTVFPEGGEGTLLNKRGGHNVTDGDENILNILNDFCKKNPNKCSEIKLNEKN